MNRALKALLAVAAVASSCAADGVVPALTAPAGAQGETQAQDDGGAGDGRLLVISLPGLTWEDVEEYELPAIEAFMDEAGLANHAPRGVHATSSPGAAYLTISAGARATSDPDVDGQLLAVDDHEAGSAAGEIFQRRTGTQPDGDYVALDWPALLRTNDAQPYDAELGLLTQTLGEAGYGVDVVGNADGTDTLAESYERQVGLTTVTPDGIVPDGDLDVDLNSDDISRPFGVRLDTDRVMERFQESWAAPGGRPGGLVMVEASDMARTMRYRSRVDRDRYDQLWVQSLQEADAMVGRLLEQVDPERDTVMLLAPYNLPGHRDLTVVAMRTAGPGEAGSPGYLRSASTQRSGVVTLVDVAPTLLDVLGVERPSAMEGQPFEVVRNQTSFEDRVDHLVALNDASRFREDMLTPTTLAIVVLLGVVTALAMVFLAQPSRPAWLGQVVRTAALFTLALIPFSYLARAFPLEDLGLGFYWSFILVGAGLVAALATALAGYLGRPRLALTWVLVFSVAVVAVDVTSGSNLSLSAAFGYSPTGNSRLYGISNYALGMFGAAVSVLAALLASRRPDGWHRFGAVGLMVAALTVVGVPIWGANVGGILSFAPVVLIFAMLVLGAGVRLRGMAVSLIVVTALAVAVFATLDLMRPAEERAHLGRLVTRIADDGLGPLFSIMERKGLAAIEVTFTTFWTAAVLIAVAFLLFLRRQPDRPLPELRRRIPQFQAGLTAAIVAGVFGTLMNDSGAIVGGTAMLVVTVTLICLVLEPTPQPPPPTPESPPVVVRERLGSPA